MYPCHAIVKDYHLRSIRQEGGGSIRARDHHTDDTQSMGVNECVTVSKWFDKVIQVRTK